MEVSKIEEIIKNRLEEETKKSIDKLSERMASETQEAINRINGVYSSAININCVSFFYPTTAR